MVTLGKTWQRVYGRSENKDTGEVHNIYACEYNGNPIIGTLINGELSAIMLGNTMFPIPCRELEDSTLSDIKIPSEYYMVFATKRGTGTYYYNFITYDGLTVYSEKFGKKDDVFLCYTCGVRDLTEADEGIIDLYNMITNKE